MDRAPGRFRAEPDFEWSPVPLARRQEPPVRERLSGPALRAFFAIAKAWELSGAEQRGLLGWPPASTFYKYKSGFPGTLSFDTLTRVSLVLGIYKALEILYPEATFADRWVRMPNSNRLFQGKAPIEVMVEGGMDALHHVRRLLDARRGG